MSRAAIRRAGGERGSLTLEMTLLAPVILALLLLVVGLGRITTGRGQVDGAAADAARAASLTRTPEAATAAAENAAAASLAGQQLTCGSLTVDVDTSALAPGGFVRVHLTCRADLSGLVFAGLPGSMPLSATAAAPIETFRASP